MNSTIWQPAPQRPQLNRDEVHVWRASLQRWADFAENVLSPEEVQRGARFVHEEHRRRFCLARAYLRCILAAYLLMRPEQIRFREGAYGKLYLLDNPMQLEFNVSHSQDLAVYALTLNHEVGIDVEWMDAKLCVPPLVKRFFNPLEQQSILTLPLNQQLTAFYRLWTRKEAYLKALGIGLSGLSTSLPPQNPEPIISLELASGYAGALAILCQNPQEFSHLQVKYFNQAKDWPTLGDSAC